MHPYRRSPSRSPQPEPSQAPCTYTGRVCHQPRSTKANGELHSLCDAHRAKANTSQRNSQQRKKQKTQFQTGLVNASFDIAPADVGNVEPSCSFDIPERAETQVETCKYPKCTTKRVAKICGKLHRYCFKHRDMAIRHQRVDAMKKLGTTPIGSVVKTEEDAFSFTKLSLTGQFGTTEVVDDSFASPVAGPLSGSFTLVTDHVPYATAAHALSQELAPIGIAPTPSNFFYQARDDLAYLASVWSQTEANDVHQEVQSGGGARGDRFTTSDDDLGEFFSVLMDDVPPDSATVLLELVELDDLNIPGERVTENEFDSFFS